MVLEHRQGSDVARLPPYHISRPRLMDRCLDEHVVVVEAGGGYGKSTFAAELVDAWRAVGIEAVLVNEETGPGLLAARLRAAVLAAGFSEAAVAMSEAGEDPQGAIEAVIAALADEQCAIVIDDAHHADLGAAHLIEHLATRITGNQRLVVLARHLPRGAERLRRAEFHQLSAADLALESSETLELCRVGFGLDVEPDEARAVDEATGGWTAASVLAIARAKRTGEPLRAVADAAGRDRSGALASLLEGAMSQFTGPDRLLLAQLGRLPSLDQELVDSTAGAAGYFDRCLAAGIPLTKSTAGGWELPGPVRDLLASLAGPDPDALSRASAEYARRGELGGAVELLLAAGDDLSAAALLATADPEALDAMDVLEIQSVVSRLGEAAVRAHPVVLVHLARSLNSATLMHQRGLTLDRAERLLAEPGVGTPDVERAAACERAKDLVRDGQFDEAAKNAAELLVVTPESEPVTRAGAFSVLGRAICWRFDEDGRRDPAALAEADDHLAAATAIYDSLGMRAAPAVLVLYRAMWIDFARGRAHSALDRLNDGLTLVVDRPRVWALLLLHRCEVELELGRFEDCEATLAASTRVAEQFRDDLLRDYANWNRAIVASHRGDAEATLEYVRLVERDAGDWWSYASAEFLASSAESLGRVGHLSPAWEYLERAKQDPQDGGPVIAMAEAVLLARAGDPELAEERLLEAPCRGVDPREYWRMTLFRALAAFRRGGREAGALAARSFEEASRLGLPHLPLTKERAATEQLLGLAVETGQPAALALEAAALPSAISVLGGFRLTTGGREVAVAAGQGRQLVKLLAAVGGRVPSDQVIDALWPEADPESGRNRLRTVLNRLKADVGELVSREGELLALRPEVRVDLAAFEAEARRALALGTSEPTLSVALARSAITKYRGDLLPEDPYEEWAVRPRERVRRTMLQLLDLCADAAASTGDLDEMRRVVEMTIDLAPYDDERYLRAASLLLEQGRRGAALTVVRRARSSLAELGLEPPLHLLRLEEAITA